MEKHDVLIVGGGGREHALGWKLRQSPHVGQIHFAPGNGGTLEIGNNIPLAATDIAGLLKFAKEESIYLTIVGPEDPLGLGIVDTFQAEDLLIYGPTQVAAQIELSKAFSKSIMSRAHVLTPTALRKSCKGQGGAEAAHG